MQSERGAATRSSPEEVKALENVKPVCFPGSSLDYPQLKIGKSVNPVGIHRHDPLNLW